MSNFALIAEGLDVSPIVAEIEAKPELWNSHPGRKTAPNTPHADADDIWLRYRDRAELVYGQDYIDPHFAVFWPGWYELPSLHQTVFDLMAKVQAHYLGGVFVTRIPPGKEVKPHTDRGSWHAEFTDCKLYVPLKGNPDCVNYCEGDEAVMLPGSVWRFDNLKVHSVVNRGDSDRWTLIICMRTI